MKYGFETRLTQHSIIGYISIGFPSGVLLELRYFDFFLSIFYYLNLFIIFRLKHSNQNYKFPILLSVEILPKTIFYGTVAPLLGYYCLKVFMINPFNEIQEKIEKRKLQKENMTKIAEKIKESESVIDLMKNSEALAEIVERELRKCGLVIVKTIYGIEEVINQYSNNELSIPIDSKAIKVTIPLQCLLSVCSVYSTLTLKNAAKSQLLGFYDPNLGEAKYLFIRYKYKNQLREVIIDLESISLPSEGLT